MDKAIRRPYLYFPQKTDTAGTCTEKFVINVALSPSRGEEVYKRCVDWTVICLQVILVERWWEEGWLETKF